MRIRALRRVLLIGALSVAACSDSESGVKDPEKFFQANQSYLETVVQRLQNSKIEGVWRDMGEAKDYMLPEDQQLYAELQQFVRAHDIGSINVWRTWREGEVTFWGITFGVKEINQVFKQRVSIRLVYAAPGIDPTIVATTRAPCKPLDPPAWHLCEWTPA